MEEHKAGGKPSKCPTCGVCLAKEIVELAPAYMWDCPNCGRENFQRSITTAITDEDRVEMDLDPCETGCWQSYPNIVICRHCDSQYTTRHVGVEEGEQNDDITEDE
ncbi:MAG: hypothetical protein WC919_00615 [Candidatus Paceibacterota bacterium]|jgi:predicted  nucleic acid-binding Zn-ribbon protein